MTTSNFNVRLLVDESPATVFAAITNVRGWWTGYYEEHIEGNSEKLNDEFIFTAAEGAHFSKQKLVEVIPDKKIVWLVTESRLSFLEDADEWTGTKIIFDITKKGDKTQLTFTHEGLMPESECYNDCAPAWTQYVEKKLFKLITTGKPATENKKTTAR